MSVLSRTAAIAAKNQPVDAALSVALGQPGPASGARPLLLILGAALSTVLAGTVQADTAANAPAASSAPELETVIVTARKVEESAQDVPVSAQVLSENALKAVNVLNVQDLAEHTTGLVISPNSQGGAPTFAVRASKQDNGTDGGVAVYLDDVVMTSTLAITNAMYDISSVQVLKGPQGTLFGVNTTGGAVVFRANKPTSRFEAYADAEGGNYGRGAFEGMINIPVSDMLQFRLAGNVVSRKGYVTNLTPVPGIPDKLADDKHESLRLSARLTLGPVTNDLVGDYYHEDDAGAQQVPVAFTPGVAALGVQLFNDPYTVSLGGNASGVNLPIYNKAKIYGVADTLNWDINDTASIKNVLAYRNDSTDTFQDNDGSYIDMVNGRTTHHNNEVVEELTLHLKSQDSRLRYTGGLYFSHTMKNDGNAYDLAQNFLYQVPAGFFFGGIPGVVPPVPASNAPLAQLSNAFYERDLHTHAIYSQIDYDLSKELTASLGLRYSWDSMDLLDFQHGASASIGQFAAPDPTGNFFGGACLPNIIQSYANFNPATCSATASGKWSAPSYTFALADKFTQGSMIYFKLSGGYQAGGLNNQIRETAYQSFLPEKVNEFEAGIKSDYTLLGRPTRTNLDAFYGISHNKQEVENGGYADGAQFIGVFNAGTLTYYGLDLDGSIYLTDHIELNAAWTHVEAQYDQFQFPSIGLIPAADLSGNAPAQIPKNTINVNATVSWPVPSEAGKLTSTISAFYRSTITFSDVTNYGVPTPVFPTSTGRSQDYTVANFTTDWKDIMGSRFSAGVYVKNLTNKFYRIFAAPQAGLGYAIITPSEPRMYGVHVRYEFH